MKFSLALLLILLPAWAQAIEVGERVAPWTLLDQFDQAYTLNDQAQVLLVARSMDAAKQVDAALQGQPKGYLEARHAVFVADIQRMPTMAYCPIGQAGNLLHHPALQVVAARHNATPAQISLAWVLRQDNMIAIPKAVNPEHLRLNLAAAELRLTAEDIADLDRAWPAPTRKQRLAMV